MRSLIIMLGAARALSAQQDSLPTVSLADAVRKAYHVAPEVVAAAGLVGTTTWQTRAALLALA
ncbi:MAG TPA: hypothetical protein VK679_10720, partial [Gemmatimonadaceae bacterium]|nr:hypothetical protein [Gemmatimonadaceae bacterium]